MTTQAKPSTAQEVLLEMVADGALVLDHEGTVVWANRAVNDILGTVEDVRGSRLESWLSSSVPIASLLVEPPVKTDRPRALVVSSNANGSEILLSVHSQSRDGEFTVVMRPFQGAVSNFDRAISFATRDAVTQLLNRDAFLERLAKAMTESPAGGIICADVKQFSSINEVYGSPEGDTLLRAIALRLRGVLGNDAPLSRIYGGRFATYVKCEDGELRHEQVAQVIESMHRAVRAHFNVAGAVQPLTLSIGVATWPADAPNADDLVAAAETAIHALLRDGNGRTRWFAAQLLSERRKFLEIEADLRVALERNELTLHYQPKVRSSDKVLIGFEALARWTHPTKGPISPGVFVPVAEQSNLIVDLGHWVMREACRQQADWRNQGFNIVPVAVNVSPMQLLAHPLEDLLAPIAEYQLPEHCMEIEITESQMMDRLVGFTSIIESLRNSGISVAIDDFGTGHSSLGNLRKLPIDSLKIDRSFIVDLEQSPEAYDIVTTIVAMAKTLSLDVVAEGVETQHQAALLRSHGVDVMQGYLYGRPVPPTEAAQKYLATEAVQFQA